MITFDRAEELREIDEWWHRDAWDTIREWIVDMVQIEPTIMRRVSHAKFGNLSSWIQRGSGNVGVCGCLVGTTAIELTKARNHFKPVATNGSFTCTKDVGVYQQGNATEAPEVVDALLKAEMEGRAYNVGLFAADLGEYLGQDRAVALIKDEIRRQLLLRAKHIRGGLKRARSAKRKSDGTFKRVA